MKGVTVLGVILIVLGAIALAYQGFSYKERHKVLDVGPISASRTERHTVPIPPVVGGVLVVGGIILVGTGMARRV